LFGSFAVAFSFISITTGIFTNYAFVISVAGPAGIWSWPLVAVGQLLVAIVFAEIACKIPITGYSYQWLRRMRSPGLGWFVGWLSFCFLVLVVPAVDFGMAPVLADLLALQRTPSSMKTIVVVTLVVQAFINILGVKLASQINNAAVFTETVGILGLTLSLFVKVILDGRLELENLIDTTTASGFAGSYLGPFILSSLMGAFTLVGFEAAANMSEETINAGHVVPKAIILSVALSGIFGTLFLAACTLSIPDVATIVTNTNPLPFIIQNALGAFLGKFFLVLVVVSIFACGLIITASGARLIYAMSRDERFFMNGIFRKVSPWNSSPMAATLLMLVLGVLTTIFAESLTLLVGATSVLPAAIYLLTIVTYARCRTEVASAYGDFTMGRWAKIIIPLAIAWLVVEIGILTVPGQFHEVTYVSMVLMALGGVLFLLFFRGLEKTPSVS